MTRTLLLVALTLVLLVSLARAQTGFSHEVGASLGGTLLGLRDRHSSPLIYSDFGIAPGIAYVHRGDHDRHLFEAAYYSDDMGTTIDNFHALNRGGRIRYTYARQAFEFQLFDAPLRVFLGGAVGSYLSHSDFMYLYAPLNVYGQGNESWYWSNSLDAVAMIELQPRERYWFRAALWLPLISSISRPTYSPSGNYNYVDQDWKYSPPWPWKGGSLEFFLDNFAFDFHAAYACPFFWNFDFQLSYEFSYAGLKGTQETRMYQNTLRGGILLCF